MGLGAIKIIGAVASVLKGAQEASESKKTRAETEEGREQRKREIEKEKKLTQEKTSSQRLLGGRPTLG